VTTALIGMGSNINPEKYLQCASQDISKYFSGAKYSNVYQSAAIGMDGDDFLNACCLLSNVPEKGELLNWLKALEDRYGRDRTEGSWKPRTLDLDLLMYGTEILDGDLSRYAHVFVPASELIDLMLPVDTGRVLTQVPLRL